MTQPHPPWSGSEISKRFEELERRVAKLEGHDVDAVVADESAREATQHKPKRR